MGDERQSINPTTNRKTVGSGTPSQSRNSLVGGVFADCDGACASSSGPTRLERYSTEGDYVGRPVDFVSPDFRVMTYRIGHLTRKFADWERDCRVTPSTPLTGCLAMTIGLMSIGGGWRNAGIKPAATKPSGDYSYKSGGFFVYLYHQSGAKGAPLPRTLTFSIFETTYDYYRY